MATSPSSELDARTFRRALALAFAVGLSLRVLFAPLQGFPGDTVQFLRWMRATVDWGITSLYDPARALDCNYPPTLPYVLRVIGEVDARLPWLRLYPKLETMLVKLPMIGFDLAVVALLAWWLQRRVGRAPALWAAIALLANPALIHLSGFWGQSDPAGFLPVLGGFFAILSGVYPLAGVLLGIAFWTKFQSVVFYPLAALMLWRKGGAFALGRAAIAGVLASVAWLSPFIVAGNPHFFRMIDSAYGQNIGRYPDLSMGAANLWALHPDPTTQDFHAPMFFYGPDGTVNARGLLAQLTWRRMGLAMFLLALAGVLAWFWRGRETSRWTAAAILSVLAFFVFPTEMHERYLYPALPLVALVAAERVQLRRPFWILSSLYWLGLACTAPPAGAYRYLAPVMLTGLAGLAFLLARQDDLEARLAQTSRLRLIALIALILLLPAALFAFWKAPARHVRVYLDELPFTVVRQEWRPPVRNASIEHRPLQLGRMIYRRGIGVHAHSELAVIAPARAQRFVADVGLDAEIAGDPRADVRFRVLSGDEVLYESPILTATSEAQRLDVPVKAGQELRLVVDGLYSPNGDHADWANARFMLEESK